MVVTHATGKRGPEAGGFIDMNQALGQGLIDQPRAPQSTTPTTLEQFAADTFAPAFRA
ncbi:MAG TPA: hypothetical protein VLI67_00220 [Vicinamibacteria bacterium]|nr:hypothetical protein [Vicinamibacteria bacterium]